MEEKQYLLGTSDGEWMSGRAYNITFIVTQDCNLRCKYCYEVNKNSKHSMSFQVAKKAVDYILSNPEIFKSKGVIFDFIGGEPFLEIELIDKITDYIKLKMFKEDHPWFSLFKLSFTSNGILYNDEKVQKYIKKNKDILSIGISIDGIKEKHDLNRVYSDGRGSYDDVSKNIPLWLEQFPNSATKVTFGSPDLKYLKESIIHLWNMGIKDVPANVVYEDVWQDGDDEIFESQMKELADYIIDNKLWDKYQTTLFSDVIGTPVSEDALHRNYCGGGMMLAIDSRGNFFPCLRYAEFSLGKYPQYTIGNIKDGFDFDKIRPFIEVTYENQSDEECLECEVGSGCGWCQALNYDTCGTNYRRTKYICKMHKARCRANEYYWGRLREEFGIVRKNKNEKSRYLYFITDDNCVEYCNYKSLEKENLMSEYIMDKGMKFAEKNFYTPVILNSKENKNIINFNKYSKIDRVEIYENGTDFAENNKDKFQVVSRDNIDKEIKTNSCVLNLEITDLENMYEYCSILFNKCDKVNLNLKYNTKKIDLEEYKRQLKKVADLIIEIFKERGVIKQFDKLTDIFFLDKMENCNAGEKSFALAPNGKIYVCPKAYFDDKDSFIGDLESGINLDDIYVYKSSNAHSCKNCSVYHCNRCVCLNKKFTNEANTPSLIQCRIGDSERKIGIELANEINKINPNTIKIQADILNNTVDVKNGKIEGLPYNYEKFIEL